MKAVIVITESASACFMHHHVGHLHEIHVKSETFSGSV